jgi:L-fuculose-phosphate aldolase
MVEFDFEQFGKELLDGVNTAADAVSTAARDTGNDLMRFKRFNGIGRDLFASGAVTSHGGNLSESDGRSIWITRTGSMLGHLVPGDVVQTEWEPGPADERASVELVVHRAIYHAWANLAQGAGAPFGVRAIVHAHTKHTTFRSLVEDSLAPVDSEGLLLLGATVPVLTPQKTVASEEVAALMAEQIARGCSVAVVRGHGPFAVADSLENAWRLVSCLEHSAELLTLFEMTGRGERV